MIIFKNLSKDLPYKILKDCYEDALRANQNQIQAISISSYSNSTEEVDARMVNLKIINEKEFIFFSDYDSPKSHQIKSNNMILALIYWPSIDTQIRMRAYIKKTTAEFSDEYYKKRETKKNALAISSQQSKEIASYDQVVKNYKYVLDNNNLRKRPDYWGGFSFTPYYFEFWTGNKYRLNKRVSFTNNNNLWEKKILQP